MGDDAHCIATPIVTQGSNQEDKERMDLAPLGAGLAAISIVGPGIGIGILAGMSASAIGRNPDAAGQIRSVAILMAAFAEGLGIIALVVALALVFVG